MNPYIGVTGFTKPEQIVSALSSVPHNHSHKMMAGILASWKSIRGIDLSPKRAPRFPKLEDIPSLCIRDKRIINLVHYSIQEGRENSLLTDLFSISDLVGKNLDGFQLNIVWPEIRQLDDFRSVKGALPKLVLQIGKGAIEQAGGKPEKVASMLYNYVGLVDAILFDLSGGLGKPFDWKFASPFLLAIKAENWDFDIGVAGGWSHETLFRLRLVREIFNRPNIDAEGALRLPNNEMYLPFVKKYLDTAFCML